MASRTGILWASTIGVGFVVSAGLLWGAISFVGATYAGKGRIQYGDPLVVAHPLLGYVRSPNARTRIRDEQTGIVYEIVTDDRGLRIDVPDVPDAPRLDRAEILTVGGSFAAGHGLANRETFTARLGRQLGVPVANAALSGYGTVGSLRTLTRFTELAPRYVIYAFFAGHLRRNLSPCAPSFQPACVAVPHVIVGDDGGFDIAGPDPARIAAAFRYADRLRAQREQPSSTGRARLGLDALRHLVRRAVESRTMPKSDPFVRYQAFEDVVWRMKNRADRAGARLLLLALPAMRTPRDNTIGEIVTEGFGDRIEVIDFARYLRGLESRGEELPPLALADGDDHPNAAAHVLIARAIAESIARDGLLRRTTLRR